jgi:hypothetical protein
MSSLPPGATFILTSTPGMSFPNYVQRASGDKA